MDELCSLEGPMTFTQEAMTGDGPLILHASMEEWEEVRNHVKNGADVAHTTKKRESALHVALQTRNVPLDVLRLLIHPKIINIITTYGESPLYIAATMRESWVMKELLRAGADPNFRFTAWAADLPQLSPMDLFLCTNLSLDVSFLEELMPDDFSIDMLTLLERVCRKYLYCHVEDVTEIQSVLRFFLMHAQFSYPLQVFVQQIDCGNGYCFAISMKPNISTGTLILAEPGAWYAGFYEKFVEEYEGRWIVQCLIKLGFTVTFPPIIQQDPNAQTQQQQQPQQEHQVVRDIKAICAQYKHQEEKEVPKLFDLCSNVVRAHVQRPFSADKFRQLNLPSPVADSLTREDMVEVVHDTVEEYHKSLDG